MRRLLPARRHGFILALAVAITTIPLLAQEDEDTPAQKTFYATATVRERPVDDATGSVTVIDRQAIEDSSAHTVTELLRGVPGLYISSGATRGGVATASIRGGDPNFTFVLLDGVPLNDVTDPQGGAVSLESLPTSLLERVEILRGPTSSFYGSTGIAGIVHLFTRRGLGTTDEPTVELEIEAGNASQRRGVASVGSALGNGGSYFVGLSWDEEEQRIADESFEQWNVQGGLDLPLPGDSLMRLHTRASSWQATDYPEASGGPTYGSGELRDSDHDEISLGAELLFGGIDKGQSRPGQGGEKRERRHRLSATWYRHELDRDTPGTFPLVPPSVETTRYHRARLGWTSTFLSRRDLEISGGVDVEQENGRNQSVLLLPPFLGGAVAGDYDFDRTQGGAHLQLLKAHGQLNFEFGLRADALEGGDTELSPRLGLSFRPRGGTTRWHASAGRAFKLPSFFALASPRALGGNPNLESETMVGVDLGVEQNFKNGDFQLGITLFANRFENLVDFDFATFLHINRSEVEAQGIELTFSWWPNAKFGVAGNVTLQEVEDRETGQALLRRPNESGNLRLTWKPADAVSLWLDLQGNSRLPDQQIPVPEIAYADGHSLLNLAGSWRFHTSWELRARFDNLFDESYETLVGFPGAGRAARIALRYKYR